MAFYFIEFWVSLGILDFKYSSLFEPFYELDSPNSSIDLQLPQPLFLKFWNIARAPNTIGMAVSFMSKNVFITDNSKLFADFFSL